MLFLRYYPTSSDNLPVPYGSLVLYRDVQENPSKTARSYIIIIAYG
jgi:hypothetical protein